MLRRPIDFDKIVKRMYCVINVQLVLMFQIVTLRVHSTTIRSVLRVATKTFFHILLLAFFGLWCLWLKIV